MSKSKMLAVDKTFKELWESLFTTPVHLDSALSKQPKHLKSILAQMIQPILLRPASLGESMGIGIAPGEPWSLSPQELARWRPAGMIAERLYQMMASGNMEPQPALEDFPPGMLAEWEAAWGRERVYELANTLACEPPLSLRAARSVGADVLLKGLNVESKLPVKSQRSSLSPLGVRLSGYTPILGSDWYKRGAFEIQDEGSQVMALFALWPELFGYLLQSAPGKLTHHILAQTEAVKIPLDVPAWNVVDACAGAGGKTLALADAMKGKGRVYSYDTSERKLQALRRRATHADLNNIQSVPLTRGAERDAIKKFRRRADVVLVDAPCSGWGVLRRNPDIKWRQNAEVLDRMPAIQAEVLDLYCDLVGPKGRLVYGVCTFRKAETLSVVEAFLGKHPEFEAGKGGFLGPDSCDGFFMQQFVRRSSK